MKLLKICSNFAFLLMPLAFADNIQQLTESQILGQYEGVTGTAPVHQTISTAGAAFEFLPNGSNIYGFFSQTLANDLYYEARLYSRYNYQTANPNVPNLPASSNNLPMGYGLAGFLGYSFHINKQVDMTPYLRVNAYKDMGPVFNDNQGDYLDSTTYSLLAGGKLVFKVNEVFAPYINIWGGYQTNSLTGVYPNSATTSNQAVTGILNQAVVTYEIGLAAKLSEHMYLVPYMGYITTFNYPDSTAQKEIDQGGLAQNNLTGTAQYFGLKLSVAW